MKSQIFSEIRVRRVFTGENHIDLDDRLAVEEPLEIRLGLRENGKTRHRAISITMRTPGHDAELAAGFLLTEGIVKDPKDVIRIAHCGPKLDFQSGTSGLAQPRSANTIRVDLAEGSRIDLKKLDRHFYTTSSCGVCGKSSIDALRTEANKIKSFGLRISAELINSLPKQLRASQDVFECTGGLHASAIFDSSGHLQLIREDVGRHNALDKVIGRKFLDGEIPLADRILLVSGRASFELVQKALIAGIPVLAAVGAPSSLAVELASEYGMTLIGFLRENRFNIYSGESRVAKL